LITSYPSAFMRWKMLGWWLRTSAAVRGRGIRPSRIAGTDLKLESKTV
jgi:hypothetical protein